MPDYSTRILVVDDNEPGRYATVRLLRNAHFDIIEAGDGASALAKVDAHRPELVVLDVNLPDMTGYDVCRHIKTAPGTSSTLVLHLSATYTDSTSKVTGLQGGADAYLTHPVSGDELVATINALLRIRRAEEEALRQARDAQKARAELEHVLAALREKNHTLEALFRASPLPIIALDTHGNVTAWNAAAERVFGWRECELLGRPLPTFLDEEVDPEHPSVEQLACRGEVLVEIETVRQRKDGTRIPVSVSAAPLLDSEARVQGSILIATDQTKRMMAEEELRRHERLVATGRMASGLAHEINNPLSAVINQLYLLKLRDDLDPELRDGLELIDSEVARVAEIATQVLATHRQSRGAVELNVSEILDAALSLYTVRLREGNVRVTRDMDRSATVVMPAGEIRQVFANLIGNSIEALPHQGTLSIRVRKDHDNTGREGVRVTIADSGCGIPADVQERIFEPFFTTKGDKGTGLGLWVVRGILEKIGATLRFRSSAAVSHRGTTFRIFLPKTAAAQP